MPALTSNANQKSIEGARKAKTTVVKKAGDRMTADAKAEAKQAADAKAEARIAAAR
jgi:hypothetical protein